MPLHPLYVDMGSTYMVLQYKVTRDPRYLNWVTLVSGSSPSMVMVPSFIGGTKSSCSGACHFWRDDLSKLVFGFASLGGLLLLIGSRYVQPWFCLIFVEASTLFAANFSEWYWPKSLWVHKRHQVLKASFFTFIASCTSSFHLFVNVFSSRFCRAKCVLHNFMDSLDRRLSPHLLGGLVCVCCK